MKTEIIQSLTEGFESHARQTENGVEFWLARDLQRLLGYTDWRNFLQVVNFALHRFIHPNALQLTISTPLD